MLRQSAIITDYDALRTYIVPYVDAYVLAEPDMATKLIDEYGVDKSIIYPLGIPIFDRFTEPFDKKAICEREGLDPNKPTILLMAGSFRCYKRAELLQSSCGASSRNAVYCHHRQKHQAFCKP